MVTLLLAEPREVPEQFRRASDADSALLEVAKAFHDHGRQWLDNTPETINAMDAAGQDLPLHTAQHGPSNFAGLPELAAAAEAGEPIARVRRTPSKRWQQVCKPGIVRCGPPWRCDLRFCVVVLPAALPSQPYYSAFLPLSGSMFRVWCTNLLCRQVSTNLAVLCLSPVLCCIPCAIPPSCGTDLDCRILVLVCEVTVRELRHRSHFRLCRLACIHGGCDHAGALLSPCRHTNDVHCHLG